MEWTEQVNWMTSPSRTSEELLDKDTVMLLSERKEEKKERERDGGEHEKR